MTSIQRRLEAAKQHEPDYAGRDFGAKSIAKGAHRNYVGGKWGKMAALQRDFLISNGLQPQSRFLDVGCGALRAGRVLVKHLDPGNYYGIDVNPSIIEAGYTHELDDDLRARLPVDNLRCTDRFDADFGVTFDLAAAQSVFTHLTLNNMRLCLWRVAKVMRPGGKFFVTFFEQPDDYPVDGVYEQGGPKRMYTERNLYWYYRGDMDWVANPSMWDFRYIGDWGHPRHQQMVEYTRLPD